MWKEDIVLPQMFTIRKGSPTRADISYAESDNIQTDIREYLDNYLVRELIEPGHGSTCNSDQDPLSFNM
jgi:hypothetical protein